MICRSCGDEILSAKIFNLDRSEFRHAEGNSAAHLKASAVGSSVILPMIYMYESNRDRHLYFAADEDEALKKKGDF
jgi:hypothetical protein